MNKKYVVRLEDEERRRLETLVSQGRAAARTIQRAWILLKADVGTRRTRLVRRRDPADLRCGAGDHLSGPSDLGRGGLERRADPASQVAASASQAGRRPRGSSDRAGVQPTAAGPLPLDRAAARQQVRRVGIRRARRPGDGAPDAQKNELKPHLVKMWCIPPQANAEFVWRMEDVLETYKLPYDPRFPRGLHGRIEQATGGRGAAAIGGSAGASAADGR